MIHISKIKLFTSSSPNVYLQRISQRCPLISRLNFSARKIPKQQSIQVSVMNSSGSSARIFSRVPAKGRQPLSGLTPSMVLVLTPMDDPRAGAIKMPVENPPTPTDRRVSQIWFICRIVRGLSETWDPLDEEEPRSFERWDRNRRILAKNVEVYRRAHPDHEEKTYI